MTNELVALYARTGERRRVVSDIVDPYQLGFSPDGKWFVTTSYRLDHVDIYRADDFRLMGRIFMGRAISTSTKSPRRCSSPCSRVGASWRWTCRRR